MTAYLALKAAHLVALFAWVAGLVAAPRAIAAFARAPDVAAPARRRLVATLRAQERWMTSPAMLAVWATGLALAMQTGQARAGWVAAKFVVLVALSAVHGVVAGRLRRLEEDPDYRPSPAFARVAWAVVAAVAVNVALAVTKPF